MTNACPLTEDAQSALNDVNASLGALQQSIETARLAGLDVLLRGRADSRQWAVKAQPVENFEIVCRYEALTAAALIARPPASAA